MIEVRSTDDGERWNELIARADRATPFHRAEALETVARYADADLSMLVGYKGEEPTGLFPVYAVSKGPLTAVCSPAPDLKIPYLGPLLLTGDGVKRRRKDLRNRRFVEACDEWIEERIGPKYTNVRASVGYDDVRPFAWNGYDTVPRYTYEVDLAADPSELLQRFSADARQNVTREHDCDWSVTQGDPEDVDRIVSQVRERHEAQGEAFPLPASLVRDLHDRLPDGTVRPYVCRVDGSFVGGVLGIETADTIYRWFGGVKTDVDLPVNDLVDWHICRDAIDRGLERYDLVGANHERIFRYKAKFAPDLRTYYAVRKSSATMSLATSLYKRVK